MWWWCWPRWWWLMMFLMTHERDDVRWWILGDTCLLLTSNTSRQAWNASLIQGRAQSSSHYQTCQIYMIWINLWQKYHSILDCFHKMHICMAKSTNLYDEFMTLWFFDFWLNVDHYTSAYTIQCNLGLPKGKRSTNLWGRTVADNLKPDEKKNLNEF